MGPRLQTTGYTILWSDPAAVWASNASAWGDLTLLAQYVYSLYIPPQSHFTTDPSIRLLSALSWNAEPIWEIEISDEFLPARAKFVGNAWTRQSWIAEILEGDLVAGWKARVPPMIVKDAFVSQGRRWKESAVLEHIQKDGLVAGVVQMIHSEQVRSMDAPIRTVQPNILDPEHPIPIRTKERIVMGATGNPVRKCPSVLNFLKGMYDILAGMIIDSGVI